MRKIKFDCVLVLRDKSDGRESCEWMDDLIRDGSPEQVLKTYFDLTECQEQICALVHGLDFDNIEEIVESDA